MKDNKMFKIAYVAFSYAENKEVKETILIKAFSYEEALEKIEQSLENVFEDDEIELKIESAKMFVKAEDFYTFETNKMRYLMFGENFLVKPLYEQTENQLISHYVENGLPVSLLTKLNSFEML